MTKKSLLFSAALIALSVTAVLPHRALAQEAGHIVYYGLTEEEMKRDRFQWRLFLENIQREPCQHYMEPPMGWHYVGCKIERDSVQRASLEIINEIQPAAGDAAPAPEPKNFTLYFDFDHSDLRPDARKTLAEAVAEITARKPSMVTVSGHTDTAGSDAYNDALGSRRADAVGDALEAQGVDQSIIKEQSFGEHQLAVETPDGQPEQQNRRVTIDLE
ncbi:MAG TPA: OmpA family protein [Patescibacteria group bacterium]|nr:OmpA family protein [Patescibacteria group bacterium]